MRTLVVGAAIVDLMMKIDRLPKSGEDISCKETKTVVGGCAYNVANTLRNLNCEHDLCVPVGSGSFADIIRRGMKEKGYEPLIEEQGEDNNGADIKSRSPWSNRYGRTEIYFPA